MIEEKKYNLRLWITLSFVPWLVFGLFFLYGHSEWDDEVINDGKIGEETIIDTDSTYSPQNYHKLDMELLEDHENNMRKTPPTPVEQLETSINE